MEQPKMTATEIAAVLKARLTEGELQALAAQFLDANGVTIVHAAFVRAFDRVCGK